jgi:hypothetical protein
MFMGFGVEFTSDALILDPILRSADEGEDIMVNSGRPPTYQVQKPAASKTKKAQR